MAFIEGEHAWLAVHNFMFGVFGTCTYIWPVMLIYVSVFERLVFLQPDVGLAGKLDARALDAATAALTAGIAQGRQAAALADCIDALADRLAPHFPPTADNPDEIKNLILI